eukprot:Seg1772.1 transcript_id=Seg1772.1/GoldUCD/mRNA.D3Y31 product="Golgin subfamily A member 5" protein_id=Seg1772.1/GoldUCD/D3Y31
MSWLSDLAKGAEALLEKVDQTAASTLQNENEDGPASTGRTVANYEEKEKETATGAIPKRYPSSASELKSPSDSNRSSQPSTRGLPRSASASNVKKKTDEQLFEFLNSGPDGADKKTLPLTSTPIKTKTQQTKPDVVPKNLPSKVERKVSIEKAPVPTPPISQLKHDVVENEQMQKSESQLPEDKIESKMEPTVTKVKEVKERDDRVSNLQLENRLLKGEITSLNEELASALRRLKDIEEGASHLERKLEHAQNQMLQQDRVVHGIEERERDLNEALKAKDSQLAILRVRMQEADDELKTKTELVNKLTSDNERIFKDHTDSTGLQSVALDSVKETLEEKEREARQLQTDCSKAQSEIMELRSRIQNEQFQMAESVKTLQVKSGEDKAKVKDLEHNLRIAKDTADTAQRDLKEYKDKATRILQAKEKLINSLKQGTAGTDASPITFTELEEVKQDRDILREELQQAKYKLEQLRVELFEVEQQNQAETEEQQEQIENLERSLEEEKGKRQHFEEELARNLQELNLVKEDLQRQKTKSATILQERDAEIQRLNHQITLKSSMSPSQEELENRVHALTDNLIQKQTLIERLSTEKNSLSLQLERLEQQYRDVQQNLSKSNAHMRHNHQHYDVEDGEDVSSSSIASIMPVTKSRRWKNTVNGIDKFSIRLGVFLRRYPVARLFVIVYVFLLHLWVTIVLLTYQPEIHSKNSKLPGSTS